MGVIAGNERGSIGVAGERDIRVDERARGSLECKTVGVDASNCEYQQTCYEQ